MPAALIAAVLWGLVYAFDTQLVKVFPISFLLCVSNFVCALLFLPAVLKSRGSWDEATNWDYVLLATVIGAATGASYLILYALKDGGGAPAIAIEATYPLFTLLFTVMLFNGTVSIQAGIGMVVVIAGAALIPTG